MYTTRIRSTYCTTDPMPKIISPINMKTFWDVLVPHCCPRRDRRRSIFRISTKKGRNSRDRLGNLGKVFKLKTDARELACMPTDDPLIFATRCALHTILAPFSICTLTSGSLLTATEDHDPSVDLESTSIKNQLNIKSDDVVELIKQNYANHRWCLVRKIGRRQKGGDRQSDSNIGLHCWRDDIQTLDQSAILDFTSSRIGYVPLNKLQPTVHWHHSSSNKRFELLISMPNGTRRGSGKSASLASNDSKDGSKDSSTQQQQQQRKPIATIRRWLSSSKKSKSICDESDISSRNPLLAAPKYSRSRIFSLKIGDKINFKRKEKLRQGISVDQSNDAFIEGCSKIDNENDSSVPIRTLTNKDKLETKLNDYNNIYGDFELINNEDRRNSNIDETFVVQKIRYSVDKSLIAVCETCNENVDLNSNVLCKNGEETCGSILVDRNLERISKDEKMTNLGESNVVDIFKDINSITLSEEENTEITINSKTVVEISSEKLEEGDAEKQTKSASIDGENVTSILVGYDDQVAAECNANMCQNSSNLNASVMSTSILLDQAASSSVKHEDSIDINEQDECSQEQSAEDQAKIKRKFVLTELVETERDYVKDLGLVVGGYMPALESSDILEDVRTKSRFVFANIQQIYEFHKNIFLKEIEPCIDDYEFVSRAFVKYERRLHMYVVYCQNKPKSEYLVSEFESVFTDIKQKLGHKLNIGDLLIKPVQRIMKYQLLMKDILKYTERAGESTDLLKKAQEVMRVVPKSCDDMMHVGRLQGFEGKITAQGKLLHQGTVSVSDNPSSQVFKGKDRRIFLFEQSIIIADCILPKKEFAVPQYIYKFHFMVNKLGMEKDVPGENMRIILKSKDPLASPPDVVLQFNDAEQKAQWIAAITQLLDTQAVFLQALTHPIAYQKALNKEPEYDASSQSSVSSLPKSKLVHQPKSSSGSNSSNLINAASPSKPQRTESYPGSASLVVCAQRSESAKEAVATSKNANGKKSEKHLSATSSVSSCPANSNGGGNDTTRKHSLPESSKHSVKNALAKSKPKNSATCVSLVNECGGGGGSCSRAGSQEEGESSPATGSPGPCTPGTKSRSKLLDGFKNTLKFFPSKTKNSQ